MYDGRFIAGVEKDPSVRDVGSAPAWTPVRGVEDGMGVGQVVVSRGAGGDALEKAAAPMGAWIAPGGVAGEGALMACDPCGGVVVEGR